MWILTDLLHSIHRLGKCGDNVFSSVEKVTEAQKVDVHHPAYGLKKDIIRLLANLVHEHKANQDKVSHLNMYMHISIPVLICKYISCLQDQCSYLGNIKSFS